MLLLGGPTGSGKNQLALRIGECFLCEIINADSRQLYRDLTIGTNQPSPAEILRVPHHLFGFLAPGSTFSSAEYEKLALPLVNDILQRKRLPLVVGGTGFYMKALLRGVWAVPPRNPSIRERLRTLEIKHGKAFLLKFLERVDPAWASRISPNDTYRVIRALEIFLQSGIRPSQLQDQQQERFIALKFYLDPDRKKLLENIKARTHEMFQIGWVEEVKRLLLIYPDFENMPAAGSIGYREIIRYLKGELDMSSCEEMINRKISQYAKRQLTWFRNQDAFARLPEGHELHKITESVLQLRGNV